MNTRIDWVSAWVGGLIVTATTRELADQVLGEYEDICWAHDVADWLNSVRRDLGWQWASDPL